ncbi:Transposase zinc-ribbon domain-containing protein [Salinibacillus kushneri]|uniref:Transposase zinc-ribbon domain-containing protein n=1 Tax=Salinibacillus kushneri TaxID=237682 RepID=A0A1I0I0Q6_9BACI|nr:Transposase zinc-ribbon domain-containing protein [Salinibacillus kushneri]
MNSTFSELLKDIDKRTHIKKEKVYQWVKRYVEPTSSVGGRLIEEMRETRFKEGFECPHCTSEHVVRFGKYNGLQRYRCKACSKIFTDTTNEGTKHNIKEFLLSSFVFEITDTYDSLRLSKLNL